MDLFNYSRRQATEVNIGATPMGGTNPIRIQSMTNTVTMDTVACVEQAKRISEAGKNIRRKNYSLRRAFRFNAGNFFHGHDCSTVFDQ